jgi:hypothetical protein
MKSNTRLFKLAITLAGVLGIVGATQAAQRTFVASNGVDNPTCVLTAPCRQFAAAIAAVTPGGEIIVLDSAGYGPVTITVPVTINAPAGVYAGISVFAGDGVTIGAAAGDKVVLRGLTMNNQGINTNGINITSAGEVHVENCVINGMSTGILAFPSTALKLVITDTIVRSSGTSGITLSAAAGPGSLSSAEIWRSVIADSFGDGIKVIDIVAVNIGDTLIAQNGAFGINTSSSATSLTGNVIALDRVQIAGNGTGINAVGTGPLPSSPQIGISHSTISNQKFTGIVAGDKSLVLLTGNQITGNGSGTSITGTGKIETIGTSLCRGNVCAAPTGVSPY